MLTPTHVAFDLVVYFAIIKIGHIAPSSPDIILLLGSDLIDLDHLFSKPIYDAKRNPFKTHFLHKNIIPVLILSVLFLLFRPLAFLGLGIILHFFLDYIDTKNKTIAKDSL